MKSTKVITYSQFITQFRQNPHFSTKQSQTMPVYFQELIKLKDKSDVIIVEFGVAAGGSLFFYRQILGKKARIIGIDLNPKCKELEKHGFEIYIGDQSNSVFLANLFQQIGNEIDIVIDDGGHTNAQQIRTITAAIPNVKDEGSIIVDDIHCSYHHRWGNPSESSTINYLKKQIDEIQYRNPLLSRNNSISSFSQKVYGIRFYDALCVLEINSKLAKPGYMIESRGNSSSYSVDFRYHGSNFLEKLYVVAKIFENNAGWPGKLRVFINPIMTNKKLRLSTLRMIALFISVAEIFRNNLTREFFKR